MKVLISLSILVAVLFSGCRLWEFYDQKSSEREAAAEVQRRRGDGSRLFGMDPLLETQYRDAMQGGVLSLRNFLERYRGTIYLSDPRLAWIEIDCALLLRYKDPLEAKRLFQQVKSRSKTGDATLQARIKDLEKSFE